MFDLDKATVFGLNEPNMLILVAVICKDIIIKH